MTNPLLNHPVLQHLPYQVLRHPTAGGITLYVARRRTKFKKLSILFAALALVYFLGMTLGRGYVNLGDMSFTLLSVMMAILCYIEFRKANMPEADIAKVIDQFNTSQQ